MQIKVTINPAEAAQLIVETEFCLASDAEKQKYDLYNDSYIGYNGQWLIVRYGVEFQFKHEYDTTGNYQRFCICPA